MGGSLDEMNPDQSVHDKLRVWHLDCSTSLAKARQKDELDDGWPESVEEQGLLLLVWRHHITKQYIKDVF